ncbi:hypothetical protein Scep_018978 [Stephania cephalantha]|uniref:Uncharacterized protein n=1 Tax=Stephania cephalantha TaxID=152367 RepID=A0AAP0NME4_9MAGN
MRRRSKEDLGQKGRRDENRWSEAARAASARSGDGESHYGGSADLSCCRAFTPPHSLGLAAIATPQVNRLFYPSVSLSERKCER